MFTGERALQINANFHHFQPFYHSLPLKHVSSNFSFRSSQSLRSFHCFRLLHLSHNLIFKAVEAKDSERMEAGYGGFSGTGDCDLPVELCQTRTLPPALTLEHGVIAIKEAIEKLKTNPPCSRSGVLRIQIAVPVSTKALSWLCSQPKSLRVFPQFYLSETKLKKVVVEPVTTEAGCGVSGIGTAVYFTGPCITEIWNSIKRYTSVDSPLIRAYGFIGINYDAESYSLKHESDSFYIFIPEIELSEFASFSILAITLAWNGLLSFPFEKAVQSVEFSIDQIIHHARPSLDSYNKWISLICGKSSFVDSRNSQMVYIGAHSLAGTISGSNHLQLEDCLASSQFYFRLSATIAFTNYMNDASSHLSFSVQDYANINALWASLIIEECTRLGLTYFCIAPGSRSSPLAVAASSHPLTTCISCFDERALAFHAVGFAKSSYKPAAVITSSGTAVSNLLPAVVEASQDSIPLLLLTADRPPELQNAGANQAINQFGKRFPNWIQWRASLHDILYLCHVMCKEDVADPSHPTDSGTLDLSCVHSWVQISSVPHPVLVNHFGSFVRFFFSLPPPTDHIPARMVLTTIDSAVHWATQTPQGPVHINCPFREPLEDSPRDWAQSCLKGLDPWMSRIEPFTQYITMKRNHACNISADLAEVLEVIKCANKGLLIIGAINTEDEMWAALLLAKHLFWPVVPDILSGLRLRELLTSFPEIEKNFLYMDYLDHALLSDPTMAWLQPDVIIQIGSRITSKRIAQMLEICSSCSYIMVDKHPYRHDPSHIVTHRIQSTITEFADSLIGVHLPRKTSKWSMFLQALNKMVAWEISFQICSEYSLTEPHVAQVVTGALSSDAALFVGNSMVIRDVDMYAQGWVNSTSDAASRMPTCNLLCRGIQVGGNRGASGIDGLLSTAIGFAVGCNKRVLCLIGDVSFLHDTNGLALLNQRIRRKPMTIVVVNNHGGAIFRLLPIADRTPPSVLSQYFYTSHNVYISKLCEAHGLKHLHVQTKMELQHALLTVEHAQADCIIEVESCIEDNAIFHSILRNSSRQAADHALRILSRIPDHSSSHLCLGKIHKLEYSSYRIQLSAPPTSIHTTCGSGKFYREGFILTLFLNDGSKGFGEVAPMEIHKENLEDVEEQLRFIAHMIQGAKMSYLLPLLKGFLSSWIWRSLGILPNSIFPSVRCGLEMALLNALAAGQECCLLNLLGCEISSKEDESLKKDGIIRSSSGVQICALLDSSGTPEEVANIAAKLFEEGFTTIKLKVARRANPLEDAAVIREIRQKIGHQVKLRADANRKWTYEQAIQFASYVKCCDLQYIEEPVDSVDDIIKFCEETGLPVALDETIDSMQEDPVDKLSEFVQPCIVAVVIKPNVVGGFENAALIAKWAQKHDKMAVVSCAFESSLSLSAYIQFARYLDQQYVEICKVNNKDPSSRIAHGLGTYQWLKEDITTQKLKICVHPHRNSVEASIEDAAQLLQSFQINHETIQRSYSGEKVRSYYLTVSCQDLSCSLKVRDAGRSLDDKVIIFLHGFLGTGEDWVPIMKALSATARCISIDLPGHGGSLLQIGPHKEAKVEPGISIEVLADVLHNLIQDITPGKVLLVGYSMGARIALYMALRCNKKINGAVIISGSPGLKDVENRRIRTAEDDARVQYLSVHGLPSFLDMWYAGGLWNSLRNHPHFEHIVDHRAQHDDVHSLANVLSSLSIGKQPSLWEDLKQCKRPLLFIVGEKDQKFKEIARQMHNEISHGLGNKDNKHKIIHDIVEVPKCGHAVHVESPLHVISSVRKFLRDLEERES